MCTWLIERRKSKSNMHRIKIRVWFHTEIWSCSVICWVLNSTLTYCHIKCHWLQVSDMDVIVFKLIHSLRIMWLLLVVEIQYNDKYVVIDAIKIISLRIKKNIAIVVTWFYPLREVDLGFTLTYGQMFFTAEGKVSIKEMTKSWQYDK